MKETYKRLKEKLKKVPKGRIITLAISAKVVEVIVATYILKRFFLK
ncbi:hypothetical protein [Thermovibrio sp.]